ncbi:transcriptional regulator, LacI family [Beutenbergia cavernae DSM 12333]|uniref:Transcriptional regulator, LacI family n=1 Tax=Beutenbergia cavernae (strain ATCC BAA-8 / DSM 12333 / CCUG 43141 / JCM 11478 / NBRC 16432 / NCIMB 13614 / HKI 0122) TaxID=471853 RepID=C5BUU8_BEUC1|nr:LacI family DNA-binding transcriptional regulator [Beutenbergia cavernae]ACQ78322.1 transcriptional regulator, LacI family [Beutenbergia cavernae DSM 12333]
MKAPTLADVAAVAGVSAKTVSNVLLGRPGVSARTRESVREAIAQVGYAVNPAGRGLASGRTGRVAVVVPMLYQPYFAEMAERLILALEAHGLATTLRIAPDGRSELDAVLGVSTRDVDAVVICPHLLSAELIGDAVLPRPVVQVGGGPVDRIDGVIMGERAGAEAVARHLLDGGRRRIALVWNAPRGEMPSGSRYEGYRSVLAEHGIDVDPALIARGSDWDRRVSGYEAMVGLLQSGARFDAAMCVNDAVAVGALRALRGHGRRVPEDVAVTGFDDTDEGEFTTPSLTSVSPHQEDMVAAAVAMLVERLGGYDGAARHVQTSAHLVVRDSSRPPV